VRFKRNAMCWCGSGKKYKKCHLNRNNKEAIGKDVIYKQLNSFYERKLCSVPDSFKNNCTKKIIKAHSVSKSSSLKDIENSGHVLTTFKTSANFDSNFKFKPKKIGINQASTFTGFCSYHDKNLFAPIEDKEFELTTYNCFLVAYRAIAREFFVKERASGTLNLIKELDRGRDLATQFSIQQAHQYFSANNDLTSSDLAFIKNVFDDCLVNQIFEKISHIILKLDTAPMVLTSAVVAPSFDFQGDKIQNITSDPKNIPHYMAVNSFSSNGKGYIVLSWLKEHKATCEKFIDSLTSTISIPDSFVTFMFATIENLYMSERWWNSLEDKSRNELINLIAVGINTPIFSDSYVTMHKYHAFEIVDTVRIN